MLALVALEGLSLIIEKVKSLLRKAKTSKVEDLKFRLEKILDMSEAELVKSREELDACLDIMDREVKRVHSQANGYPNSIIAGDVWFDGTALASYGESLAGFLSDKNFLNEQAKATNLWTGAVLSVCSHYHHMVGPAMIANAEINERIGNLEYAKTAYSGVLQDFECILEYAGEEGYRPEREDLVALKSLEIAACKLIELNELSGVNAAAVSVLERIKVVMMRPEEPEECN